MAVSLLTGALGGLTMIGQALTRVCVAANFLGAARFRIEKRNLPLRPYRSHAEKELLQLLWPKKGVIDDLAG